MGHPSSAQSGPPDAGSRSPDPRDEEIERLRDLLDAERRRSERELAFARRIQLNLMPTDLPTPPGWQLATAYRAARVVGGDFYDAYELPSAKASLGLAVADVTGKGLPAALMMAFSRAVMRSAAYNGSGPADALRRTNRVLVRDARTGLFLTALVGRLDTSTGRLRYANAGHEPPLLFRSGSRRIRELQAPGTMLGLLRATSVADRVVTLSPGDLFLVYTDGVTDALAPDGRRFGLDRLVDVISRAGDAPASAIVAAIVRAVDGFAGEAEQADDMTLLAVKRSG